MQNEVDEVRAPLPVVRETLYGDSMYYGLVSFFCFSPSLLRILTTKRLCLVSGFRGGV